MRNVKYYIYHLERYLISHINTACQISLIVFNIKGPADTDSNADILFLAIEQCTDLNLLAFIDTKYKENEINAIYIDEAHLIITWSEFRPKFNELPSFRRYFAVPWVLLSATVPEYLEQELSKMFGNLNVIRMPSNRPNLAYECKFTDDIDQYVVEYVKKYSISNRSTIVYVRYIDKVDEILSKLYQADVQAVGYHSKMEDEEREKNQKAFMDDDVFVIVATSGFGMGIDKGTVRVVIHAGASYSGCEYLQMAGRAGRNGQKSLCTTVTNDNDLLQLTKFIPENDNDLQFSVAQSQMKKYLAVLKVLTRIKLCCIFLFVNEL